MGSRQRSPYVGWPDFKMAAPINVLVFSWRYHQQGTNACVLKYIEQLIEPPQSAVVIAMCSNYFKVANLKQPKVRIVDLLSFFLFFLSFFNQSSTVMR